MQIPDLIIVLRHIERALGQGSLSALYTAVQQTAQQMTTLGNLSATVAPPRRPQQAQQAQPVQPSPEQRQAQLHQLGIQLSTQRQELETAVAAAEPPAEWSPSKRTAFDRLGAGQVLGHRAIDTLVRLFSRNAFDAGQIAQGVQTMIVQLAPLQTRVTTTLPALISVDGEPSAAAVPGPPSDGALIHIYFGESIHVDRMSDLADWSKSWDHIIKTVSDVNRSPTESPRLVEITRGSLELTILVDVVAVAASLASIMASIASMYDKSLTLKKIAQQLRGMDVEDEPAKLDAKADQQFEALAQVAERMVEENKWESGSSDANERQAALTAVLRDMQKFYVSGGRLKIRLPPKVTVEDGEAMLERANAALEEIEEKTRNVDMLLEALNSPQQLPPKRD